MIRRYFVWVKGRKTETARIVRARTGLQAQIRMAAQWSVKSYEIECVWLKPGSPERLDVTGVVEQ